MIKKLKQYMFLASTMLMMAVPALVPTIAASAATCSTLATNIGTGVDQATANTGTPTDCSDTGVSGGNIGTAAASLVKIFSIIVGVVAVIMIIYGGFRYITSGGDSGRVGAAKNSLIYAIVGLVIVALAQLIVHFVLNQSAQITTT